jgi:hypothetical protein
MEELTANIFAIQAAIAEARRSRAWIVVVTPTDEELASTLGRMFVTLLPPDASLGGRTAVLPNGGRVTIVAGSEPLHGDGFRVMFLGFEGKLLPADEIAMHAWREAAKGTVTLGEQPGEVTVR